MLGSPILYLKGMRILMFKLSGFYYRGLHDKYRIALKASIKDFRRAAIRVTILVDRRPF